MCGNIFLRPYQSPSSPSYQQCCVIDGKTVVCHPLLTDLILPSFVPSFHVYQVMPKQW